MNFLDYIYAAKEVWETDTDAYGLDDIQIDADAEVSEGNDGAWVAAWLWVEKDLCEDLKSARES